MSCFCGHSKICITPEFKLTLAGYAHRKGNFDSVKNDLFIRALYLKDKSDYGKIIITADLIWWDSKITDELKNIINTLYKINKNNIIFSATHTHCGPQTSFDFTPSLGIPNIEYIEFVKKQTLLSIDKAVNNTVECTFFLNSAECEIGINRRFKKNGKIEMAPFSEGINDTTLNMLEIRNEQDDLISLLVHGICHANVSAENCISPDFPGIAMSKIEDVYPESTAFYLQGFCGDIRPNIVSEDDQFIRSDNEKATEIAKELSAKVISALENKVKEQDIYNDIEGCEIAFTPEFKNKKTLLELKQIVELEEKKEVSDQLLEWAETMIENENYKEKNLPNIRIQGLSITKNFILLGINSEIVLDYHKYLKEKVGNKIIPIAYTNGMIGYIATEKQLAEGGYEADEMYQYFALPSPFKSNIETKLKSSFDLLWRKIS
jgi:hypothetical protein